MLKKYTNYRTKMKDFIPVYHTFLNVPDAARTMGVTQDSLYAKIYQGNNSHWLVKNERNSARVNVSYFHEMLQRNEEIKNQAHDLLFALEEYGNTHQLSKILSIMGGRSVHAWNSFFQKTLFLLPEKLMYTHAKGKLLEFCTLGTRILNELESRYQNYE